MKVVNKLLSILFVIAIVILTLTVSIGLPIYIRPFYYAHVYSLDMAEMWGIDVSDEEIIEAYDEVLDFLTLEGKEFGTGVFPFSEEGKGHFEDCKVLFDLNRNALIVSLVIVVTLLVLNKIGKIKLSRPRGYSLGFYAGIGTLSLCVLLGVLIASNFAVAFRIFHQIFFPGKTNWMFNPYKDPIVLFMPQKFFMNCAILIGASIVTISTVLILAGIIGRRKTNK